MQCNAPECHDEATLYWEAVYGYGYNCFGHEPSWEDIEMPTGGYMLPFRVIELGTKTVVDEYNPMNYDWSDSE